MNLARYGYAVKVVSRVMAFQLGALCMHPREGSIPSRSDFRAHAFRSERFAFPRPIAARSSRRPRGPTWRDALLEARALGDYHVSRVALGIRFARLWPLHTLSTS